MRGRTVARLECDPSPARGVAAAGLLAEPVVVRAPGKLLLAGEYAVLVGGPAVVLATDRAAAARLPADREARVSRLSAAAARLAGEATGSTAVPLPSVDTVELYRDGLKLGLGSSAATAVATAGAVFAGAGWRLDDPTVRHRLFVVAHRAQAEAQDHGGGSGADVAASVYGGLLRYQRPPAPPQNVESMPAIERLPLSGLPPMSVIWTRTPAETPTLVSAFLAWRERSQSRCARVVDRITASAEALAAAVRVQDRRGAVAAFRRCGEAYHELGRAAELDLFAGLHADLAGLAAAHGGAAKPSGAGRGDLAVALFETELQKRAFEAEACELGHCVLTVARCTDGVHHDSRGGVA